MIGHIPMRPWAPLLNGALPAFNPHQAFEQSLNAREMLRIVAQDGIA